MKKSRFYSFIILLTVCSYFMYNSPSQAHDAKMKALTAKKEKMRSEGIAINSLQLASTIGESILKEKYGEETIENQKPFLISLKDDIWTIEGTKGREGKNSHIEICKATGSILAISN